MRHEPFDGRLRALRSWTLQTLGGPHGTARNYYGYFTDPDEYYWEVAWNPGLPLGDDGFMNLAP